MRRSFVLLACAAALAGCDIGGRENEPAAAREATTAPREATTGPSGKDECAPTRVPERTGTFHIGGFANLIAFGEGAAWTVTEHPSNLGGEGPSLLTVRRIDPRRGVVESFLRIRGRGDMRIAAGAGAVWLADPATRTLTRFDLATRDLVVVKPFRRSGEPTAIALESGRAWVAANDRGELAVVTARTGRVLGRVRIASSGLADVEAAFSSLWVATGEGGSVVRVDPRSRKVIARIRVEFANDLAADDSSLWVDLGDGDAVARIDPATNAPVGRPHPHGGAFAIAAGLGSVWATNYPSPRVTRLDATTGERAGELAVGPDPKGLAIGAGSVWVVNAGDCSVTRIVP
jgi:streptogramin lyase